MNFKTLWADRRMRIALLAGSGLLVAFAAFVVAGAADDTPGWIPAPFAGDSKSVGSDGETVDGTSGAKASASNAKPVSNNTVTAGTDGTDAPATADTPADSPGTAPSDPPATDQPSSPSDAKTMTLRILYWNDTEARPASVIVSIGEVTWAPEDDDDKSAEGKLIGLPFDTALKIVVMPDGAQGTRIEVPIRFTSDMVSDSAGDAVHVEIKDGTVRVLGTPVDNFDVTLDRF